MERVESVRCSRWNRPGRGCAPGSGILLGSLMVLCISSGLFGDPIPAAEGPSAQQGAEVMDGGSAPDEAAQERELRAEQLAEAQTSLPLPLRSG